VIIIAAMAANRVIGREGAMPWHLPDELQWFKATTMGHAVIMGRKTYQSIGHPLPGRTNIVISRNRQISFSGCIVASSLQQAFEQCAGQTKAFIAGGAEIYALALPVADTILLTVLDLTIPGDTVFPPIPEGQFIETTRETVANHIPYTRLTYQRSSQPVV